jgi:hypothetical protein
MKTKSQVKSSKIKSAPGSQSKLASIRGAVKNAIFGTGKKQTPVKSAAPNKTSAKTAKTVAPAKSAAPAKPAAAAAAKKSGAKATAGKTAAPVKAALATKAPTAPAKTAAASKVAAPVKAPATVAAGKAGKAPAAAAAPAKAPTKAEKAAAKTKNAIPGTSLRTAPRSFSRHSSEEVCREVACEGLSTSGGYCRLHYIKNWKKIKRKELILKEGKLNQYIEELVAKYPDKYIEAIRQDLAEDKAFAKVIYDLDLDENADEFSEDGENVDNLIDTIKRDFDDEGDAF